MYIKNANQTFRERLGYAASKYVSGDRKPLIDMIYQRSLNAYNDGYMQAMKELNKNRKKEYQ